MKQSEFLKKLGTHFSVVPIPTIVHDVPKALANPCAVAWELTWEKRGLHANIAGLLDGSIEYFFENLSPAHIGQHVWEATSYGDEDIPEEFLQLFTLFCPGRISTHT